MTDATEALAILRAVQNDLPSDHVIILNGLRIRLNRAIQQTAEAADREAAERTVQRGTQAPTANPSAAADPQVSKMPCPNCGATLVVMAWSKVPHFYPAAKEAT